MLARRLGRQVHKGHPQLANSDSPLVVAQRAATAGKLVDHTLPLTNTHMGTPTQNTLTVIMKTSMIVAGLIDMISTIMMVQATAQASEEESPAAQSTSR